MPDKPSDQPELTGKSASPEGEEKAPKLAPMPLEKRITEAREGATFEGDLDFDADEAEPRPSVERDLPEDDDESVEEEAFDAEEEEESKPIPKARGNRPADFEPRSWSSDDKSVNPEVEVERLSTSDGARLVLGKAKSAVRSLNPFEMACLGLVAAFFLVGLFYFRGLASSGAADVGKDYSLKALKLPAKGQSLAIGAARSYWKRREKADLANPENVLVPVVELDFQGGGKACKVFFRDEKGKIRGDVLTKDIGGGQTLTLVGTEGYLNPLEHESVRSGQQKPWRVEVFECDKLDSPLEQSSLIAEFDIPADEPIRGKAKP